MSATLQSVVKEEVEQNHPGPEPVHPSRKIWIDLENSPHVPFFIPIMRELENRGHKVVLTARDCFQVCELADLAGLEYRTIGRHYGKNRLAKVFGLGVRVGQLAPFILRERPDLSVAHGSRSLLVLSGLLKIPSLTLMDYEHASQRFLGWLGSPELRWTMTPEVVPSDNFERGGVIKNHVLHYPGIKEDVYVPFFQADPSLRSRLGLRDSDVVVTIRPPATEAHYHNPESELLLKEVFQLIRETAGVKAILLPRTARQEADLRRQEADLFADGRVIVPKQAIDGLDLIWSSDVVISGGGTMNREAAALGVPVYSLFRGKLGAVDKHLADNGKLILLESVEDVRGRLRLVPRSKTTEPDSKQRATLDAVVNHICAILEQESK